MKWLFDMFLQEIHPHRVIPALKPWSSEVVLIHTSAETITLRKKWAKYTKNRLCRPYRMDRPTHVHMTCRYEEGHLHATIDTILDADFLAT